MFNKTIEEPRKSRLPNISILIPTYNRERFVGVSIKSVLTQTYKDLELIVVDDGSTDKTSELLAGFGNNIRVIRQDNQGVSEALNRGLIAARGEWIGFLDSDDEWLPGYLEMQMQRVAQCPDAIVHVTNAYTVLADQTKEDLFQMTLLSRMFGKDEYLLLNRPLSTIINHGPWFRQAMIMRNDVLSTVGGFDPTLRIAEDFDVIAKMALKGPFSIYRRALVHVIRREEAIQSLVIQARQNRVYTYNSYGKVLNNLLSHQGLRVAERRAIRRALNHNWRAMGNVFVIAGRRAEAIKYYMKSFTSYPSLRSLLKCLLTAISQRISLSLIKDADKILPGDDTES